MKISHSKLHAKKKKVPKKRTAILAQPEHHLSLGISILRTFIKCFFASLNFIFNSKCGIAVFFFFVGFGFHFYFCNPIQKDVLDPSEVDEDFLAELPEPEDPPPFVLIEDTDAKTIPPFILNDTSLPSPPILNAKKQDYQYGKEILMEVTGYCSCEKCCGWGYNWMGKPVFKTGPKAGKPKKIGLCANGQVAKLGTIAAPNTFPFGTIIEVPGYPLGKVQDRGSRIKGNAIDLFFPNHRTAMQWGRKKIKVRVWKNMDAWRADHPEYKKRSSK